MKQTIWVVEVLKNLFDWLAVIAIIPIKFLNKSIQFMNNNKMAKFSHK